MPTGLRHYQQTRDLHFLTFSCYHRLPYFGAAAARELFESALERIRRRYEFVVKGYAVMPEHLHLLVSEPIRSSLSVALQVLKQQTSRKLKASGETQFWQRRY
jgi:putative transposase